MAKETGTATDYLDLVNRLRLFLTGAGTYAAPGYTGTGNGTLSDIEPKPIAVTETWTLTCTTGGGPGVGVFSVTGSVSGAQAAATVGQFYENTLIEFLINDGSTNFVVSDQFTINVTQGQMTAAGDEWTVNRWNSYYDYSFPNGNFSNPENAVDEDPSTDVSRIGSTTGIFQVDFTHAVDIGSYKIRSVDDASAATDTPQAWTLQYSDDGGVTWTTADTVTGQTTWAATEIKTYTVASPSRHKSWRLNITSNNGAANLQVAEVQFIRDTEVLNYLRYPGELQVEGPGASGTDSIFIALFPDKDEGAPWFNIALIGLQNYDATVRPDLQVGASTPTYLPNDDGSSTYWFVANGRRFVIVNKIGSAYVNCYAGFILPYGLPVEWPYPLLVAANDKLQTRKFSDTNIAQYRAFFDPGDDAAWLCDPAGSWLWFENYTGAGSTETGQSQRVFSPYRGVDLEIEQFFENFRDGPGGVQPLYPIMLQAEYPSNNPTELNNYGELDGVAAVSGFNLLSEDTLTVGADTWYAFQGVYRSDRNDFMALKWV